MRRSIKRDVQKYLPAMLALTIGLAIVISLSYIYVAKNQPVAGKTSIARDSALATPVAESEEEEEEEEEMVAFEFPAEGPIKTYHMDHDQEAIVTMYWGKHTWAHIERFSSEVWPNEPTILELEEPKPGLYPLKLDTGEIRGYVQVD